MHRYLNKGSLLAVAAVALLASGCTTTQGVQHAQSTADQALSTAQEAKQMAADAQAAAHAAQQGVDQMRSEESSEHHHGGQRG